MIDANRLQRIEQYLIWILNHEYESASSVSRAACVHAIRQDAASCAAYVERIQLLSSCVILFTDKYRQRHVMDIDHRFISGVP